MSNDNCAKVSRIVVQKWDRIKARFPVFSKVISPTIPVKRCCFLYFDV
jgi:hypothetical protein